MTFAISDPSIVVNNEPIGIVPNSVKFKEGLGEQKMRAASTGGGNTIPVYSEDVTTNFGMIKFSMYNDIDSIENARKWKKNKNSNVVTLTGKDPSGKTITRTFLNAAIMNDYEADLSAEGVLELEFTSSPAV